jgi:hypothetical protein
MGSPRTLLPMTSLLRFLPISLLCLAPLAVQAQERSSDRPSEPPARAPERPASNDVPREMLPPAGKCRIWMGGVAPSQQPAPTDCQTALRQRPANGTVVFGPASKSAPARGFASPRPARDTTARETRPSRSARPANTAPRSDSSSRRRRPEPRF